MDLPPRHPQPAIEALLEYAGWRDVLNLLSVDKREAPARCWLINNVGLAVYNDAEHRALYSGRNIRFHWRSAHDDIIDMKHSHDLRHQYGAFIEKYPGCVREMRRDDVVTWTPPGVQRIRYDAPSYPIRATSYVFAALTPMVQTLTHLTITNGNFSPPFDFVFPSALRYLYVDGWSGSMDCLVASTITHLSMRWTNTAWLGSCLPPALTHLEVLREYAGSLTSVELPSGLRRLIMPCDTYATEWGVIPWPTSLTHLHIGSVDCAELPRSLTHLKLTSGFWEPMNEIKWPSGLTHLCMREKVLGDGLPPTLRNLTIVSTYFEPVWGLENVVWPTTLCLLTIVSGTLPANVEHPPESCTVRYFDRFPSDHW
jgi:hypothetical protein